MKISGFYKSIFVLASGTAAGQVIMVAVLPLLTRLYTPDDLGLLAVYTAVIAIVLTISCFRLETAIPKQKSQAEAQSVLTLCFTIIFFNTLVSLLVCLGLYFFWPELLGSMKSYVFFIPLGLLVGGLYQSINNYAVREKEFSLVSKSRLWQALSAAVIQIVGGVVIASPLPLLVGYISNLGAGAFYIKSRLLSDFSLTKNISFYKVKNTFYKNKDFPKYSVVEAFANTASIQIPILIIASSLGISESAFIFLAIKIIQAPMALLGSSISQVFYSKASESHSAGKLQELTLNVIVSTFQIGVGPILFVAILAPMLINMALGTGWEMVGHYIVLMSPWFLVQFVASPISTVMYVVNRQYEFMLVTIFGFIVKVSSVICADLIGSYIVETFVVSNVLFYFVAFIRFSKAGGVSFLCVLSNIIEVIYVPILWVLSALALNFLLSIF